MYIIIIHFNYLTFNSYINIHYKHYLKKVIFIKVNYLILFIL